MKTLFYSIEIRDKEGKRYKDKRGYTVQDFKFEDTEQDENLVHLICKHAFENYQAICKEGSQINITVSYFNSFSSSYSLLYSFYGAENKFIKHT